MKTPKSLEMPSGLQLIKVGSDDIKSYGDQYDWLYEHPASALLFDRPEETWDKIKSDYNGVFKNLVIDDFPRDEKILRDIKRVSERLKSIEWEIG